MKELLGRRNFIKKTGYLVGFGALASSPFSLMAEPISQRLLILHTNDWHSRIEPFPAIDKNYGGKGGAAYRATLIKQLREQNEQVLLLDAGDIFQGTPYFNFYGGELEFKLMTQMGYDAATLGNHDFDNGLDGLAKQIPHAGFSMLNCNYTFNHAALKEWIKPYKIFKKGKVKVGVLGVGIELKGLVPDKMFGDTIYHHPIDAANKTANLLRQKGCDLIVCLSHLGNKYNGNKVSDETLATQTENIDLIIGGHTHTFLNEPQLYKNKLGKEVLVNQVGWAGLNLGCIEYEFSADFKRKGVITSSVKSIANIEEV